MHAVLLIIGIGWLAFWVYWLVAAFTAKASRGRWSQFAGARVILIVLVAYFIRQNWIGGGKSGVIHNPALEGVGLALWVAGLGLAVWARLYIGRNWGMPMTQKENPDLVTTGPYHAIRHPIYTGIILGLLGTALATSLYLLIAAAILAGYFVYSAVSEERYMTERFPDAYPEYKAHSKMLIPFVF